MNAKKKRRLRAAGFKTGTVQDFLGLTDDETRLIEIKVALALALKQKRKRQKLTQKDLAEIMGSDQSRVARVEKGDGTLDLIVRALLKAGATRTQIGRALAGTEAGQIGQAQTVKRSTSRKSKRRSAGQVTYDAKTRRAAARKKSA